jgi:hypothetical protein
MAERDRQRRQPPPENFTPLISPEVAGQAMEGLTVMQFFPSAAIARTMVANEIMALCAGPSQALWLVSRMLRLYEKWPGIPEMRRVFGSRFRPADGIEPIGISETYPDGIPAERPMALPSPEMKRVGPGECSADQDLCGEIDKAAGAKTMPPALHGADRSSRVLRDSRTAPRDRAEPPGPTPQVITQADVDRELELRRQAVNGRYESGA